MPTLSFFKNFRKDGGVRFGIRSADEIVFHAFVPGELPEDPTLDWFVDLTCEGRRVPGPSGRFEESRRWFLDNVALLQTAIREMADRLEIGVDGNGEPFRIEQKGLGPIAKVVLHGTANRRIRDTDIAERLKEFADQLPSDLESLELEVAGRQ